MKGNLCLYPKCGASVQVGSKSVLCIKHTELAEFQLWMITQITKAQAEETEAPKAEELH